jgi:hypothetical protein
VRIQLASLSLVVLAACAADADVEQSSLAVSAPAEIAVPAGNHVVLEAQGIGSQVYECKADASGALAWTFRAPIALLFADDHSLLVAHFGGVDVGLPAGVYWQSVIDGSRVHGGNAVAVPNPGQIPLLRLEGVDHAGRGVLANVSFIQRLDTVGGVGPTGRCPRAGLRRFVPYTATYVFYAPSLPRPEVPETIVVPAGNDVGLIGHATGVQIYECAANGTWAFHAPRATLFDDDGAFIEHFGGIDANLPAGAYWQSTRDGSRVHGGAAATAPQPGAIPLLRLPAADTSGHGILSGVTFIQRLDTVGGVSPTGACDPAGPRVEVPYTADYYFYRKTN